MVRKRTRKYESDDNDSDSDLDFNVDESSREPAPKKYSLRERKRAPVFTTEFDYYGLDDDDGEVKKQSSDDEDFEVEADVENTRTYFEPDESITQNPENDGLIDFEDIIRADIVVNKNKIDYDNLIQKTEIKLSQPPKRRGRKPKNHVQAVHNHEETPTDPPDFSCGPDINTLAHLEQQDGQENKNTVHEINFCEGQEGLPNGDCLENSNSDKIVNNETDPLAMKSANNIETILVKPPLLEDVPKDEKAVYEDEDDDVILLEDKKEDIIVLDD